MRQAISRSGVLAVMVVLSAFAAAPALASDAPVNFTATARSDHLVKLDWSWPASPTYPDELDVRRDGVFVSTVAPSANTFSDVVTTAGSTHTYALVPVNGGTAETPLTAQVTLRADAANPPTNVQASFDANNIATVTWTRGDQDADVAYTVTAQQTGGGPLNTRTVRYADPGSAGSATMDVFASSTSYVFKVSAVEDVNDPPGDPGGTVPADGSVTTPSNDVIPPQFSGTLSAARSSLGTVTATWPAATDAGSGVTGYTLCVDATNCSAFVPAQPLETTQSASVSGIRNDGALHAVSVVAQDGAGNLSVPIGIPLLMPIPAKPAIEFTSGGNGCAPLVAQASSSDTPAPAFHLYVDGTEVPVGSPITGAPYQQVSLVAQASSGADVSLPSTALLARVWDPDGPADAPQIRGQASQASSTEILSWDPIIAQTGAPIASYLVTIGTLPGYGNGVAVPQSEHPSIIITGLVNSDYYIAQVSAVDGCGRSGPANPTRFKIDDITPPSAPVLNAPTTDGNSIHLSWSPSTDNVDVADYMVFQEGRPGVVTRTPNTFYDITGLTDYYTGSYYVIATDFAGNQSVQSATRTATTRDTTPPNPPGSISALKVQDGTVALTWGAASDNVGVVGYQVLRDGLPVQNVVSTSFTDRNLKAGTYSYQVRAYDAANNLSAPRSISVATDGTPQATTASAVKVVKSKKGTKVLRVGGKAGSRIVLSFKITQPFNSARLKLNVLKSVPTTKRKGSAKARVTLKPKLRVSLPAGSGRTQAGKRLAERRARKGTITIPIGRQKAGTLRLIVTATGGVLTLSGGKGGKKAPTIVAGS